MYQRSPTTLWFPRLIRSGGEPPNVPAFGVLRAIFRVLCACCVPSVFPLYAVWSVCFLCAVRSGYRVHPMCVCRALCAVLGSFFAWQCHAVPYLPALHSFRTETLSPDAYVYVTISVSFSSFFLYPGADYTVPLAFQLYHVYGNPRPRVHDTI